MGIAGSSTKTGYEWEVVFPDTPNNTCTLEISEQEKFIFGYFQPERASRRYCLIDYAAGGLVHFYPKKSGKVLKGGNISGILANASRIKHATGLPPDLRQGLDALIDTLEKGDFT